MTRVPTANRKTRKIRPANLIEKLSSSQYSGCSVVTSNSVSWLIYFDRGQLAYATNLIEPFERLERHLRRLSRTSANLSLAVCRRAREKYEVNWRNYPTARREYQAVCWLVQQQYLRTTEAATLIQGLMEEVFETFLLLPESHTEFIDGDKLPILHRSDWQTLVRKCKSRLKAWQALAPQIKSSYQRPYFSVRASSQIISLVNQQKLSKFLKGYNFRQLAVLLNQDEIKLAQRLYPLIENQVIVLQEPRHPFDKLPAISKEAFRFLNNLNETISTSKNEIENALPEKRRIVCIDDSKAILNMIGEHLKGYNASVFQIEDPMKGLLRISKIRPDLIFLDIGMPNLDGCFLCALLRKNSLYKQTPIVMVTGHDGRLDRVKANLAGATDYLTKPFTKVEFLQIVDKYLK